MKRADEADVATLQAEIVRAEALAEARTDAESAEKEAASRKAEAQEALGKAQERERKARREYGAARDVLSVLSPPAPRASLLEDWEELACWASGQATELAASLEAATGRERDAKARHTGVVEQARGLCAPYFDPGGDPSQLSAEMAVAAERAANAHGRAVEQRQERIELEERIERVAVQVSLWRWPSATARPRWLRRTVQDWSRCSSTRASAPLIPTRLMSSRLPLRNWARVAWSAS